ncbi:NAD-dependent epimerase/dehydratase family protein [Desulfovibrionales bacterium]
MEEEVNGVEIDHFRGKRVLITGGLGFIGSNLARRLVSLGAHVLIVDSLISEYGGSLANIAGFDDRVHVNISDVRDPHSMKYLVQGQDFLFNLAGQTSHLDSMTDPYIDLEINCRAQLSILEACRYYNRDVVVVFASTRQIYGKPQYLPVNESHLLQPVDVNGINKMAGEWYHILYNNVYGIRACALRLTNTYGPRMRIKDARQTFVGWWIRLILEDKPIEVWGGEQLRDFIYVEDCVDAMLLAAANERAWGRVFNLGGNEVINLRQLGELLVASNGSGCCIVRQFPEDRKRIDIGDYYGDYTAIRSMLGWNPRTSIDAGLVQTLAFYRNQLELYV